MIGRIEALSAIRARINQLFAAVAKPALASRLGAIRASLAQSAATF
jgi:hypothetical protein